MTGRIGLAGLAAQLARESSRPVALGRQGAVSAGDLLARAQAWRGALAATPGVRVALYFEDSIEFAAALIGAWQAGKCVVLAADTLPATLHSLASKVDCFAGEFPDAVQAAADAADMAWTPLDPSACLLVLHTSGSSGEPVAIGKRLDQLDSEITALESCFGARLGEVLVQGTVSHQHIYGLLFRVLWPLSTRRVFAAARLAYPEQIAAAALAGPMVLVASPALLKRLPETVDWTAAKKSLRLVFCSGGPLPPEAVQSVRQLWQRPLLEVLGSTETGGIAWREPGLNWSALPGVQVRVEDEQLEVRSAHLSDANWYRTQDRALAQGTGFQLLGRADRLLKLEERRISLTGIEKLIESSAWIESARTLVLPGVRQQIAAAAVTSAAGSAVLREQGRKALVALLREALRGQVDAIAVPRHWRFLSALPADSQGKTPARLLAPYFQANRPAPTWVLREATRARLHLCPPADLQVFDGHFPQAPILPGVALVDWAIRWGREAFAIRRSFLRMDAMKFQRVVLPGTPLDLSLDWQSEPGTLGFRFESAQGVHAGGRILFSAGDAS